MLLTLSELHYGRAYLFEGFDKAEVTLKGDAVHGRLASNHVTLHFVDGYFYSAADNAPRRARGRPSKSRDADEIVTTALGIDERAKACEEQAALWRRVQLIAERFAKPGSPDAQEGPSVDPAALFTPVPVRPSDDEPKPI